MAAADIGHFCASLELFDDAIERRKPGRDEIGVIAGTEEPFCSMKKTRMMFTPFHALSTLEVFKRTTQCMKRGFNDVVRARHVDGPVGVGQAKRLFLAE